MGAVCARVAGCWMAGAAASTGKSAVTGAAAGNEAVASGAGALLPSLQQQRIPAMLLSG